MSVSRLAVILSMLSISASSQTFTSLFSFDGPNGADPYGTLVQAIGGNFYGTTYSGGVNGWGTVFRVTPTGMLTSLHSFNGTDGGNAYAGLVQSTGGNFYGTTYRGGKAWGTIFRITPSGMLTSLHGFDMTDGSAPAGALIQAINGNFYGTTEFGGANNTCIGGCGTVFEITPQGLLTTLDSFDRVDGAQPYAGLVQAEGGILYGTSLGDTTFTQPSPATVFTLTPSGTLTLLYSGTGSEGPLVEGSDGDFYATTNGTVFKISPQGVVTTLYTFCSLPNCADGTEAVAGLVLATDGNFYGTTASGGNNSCASGCGTIFKITPAGVFTTLHSFVNTDGSFPNAGLMQATDGNLYGTTTTGGVHNFGTVFRLSLGLAPFIRTLPTAGKVGASLNYGESLDWHNHRQLQRYAVYFYCRIGFRDHHDGPSRSQYWEGHRNYTKRQPDKQPAICGAPVTNDNRPE